MQASRRDCLKLGLLVGFGGAITGCSVVTRSVRRYEHADVPSPKVAASGEERMLNRCGFGPNAESLAMLRNLGREAFVEDQLSGHRPQDPALTMQLQPLDVLQLEPADLRDLPSEHVLFQLQQAAILQAVYSENQLRERLIDFWSNHFNIYGRKGNTSYAKGLEETQIIRKEALGSFPRMLGAMAHSPAMLEYLDNQYNVKGVANENYARELMELHTLGLHGGYSQKDVQEVARCFTGWGIETRFLRPRGMFRFDKDRHDDGAKVVLGHSIPAGGGEQDGMQVLEILSNHPSTAKFLATKLSRYFLGEVSDTWVDRIANDYLRSHGDIPTMLRPLLISGDLLDSQPILKRPFDFMVSALRVMEADTDGGAPLQAHLNKMGEPLYQWPMPDGYPMKTSSWTSSLLPRWNFATALTAGTIARTSCSARLLKMGVEAVPIATRCPVEAADGPTTELALCLASPDFQWR